MKLKDKLKEQVENTKTKDEAKAILEDAGLVLTDTELDQVTGGAFFADIDKVKKA